MRATKFVHSLEVVPRSALAITATLGALSLASWVFVAGANMPMAGMLDLQAFVLFTVIWGVGMVAMMFPSLVPMAYMISVSAKATDEQQSNRASRFVRPTLFIGGYVGVWTLVGVAFYLAIAVLVALGQSVSLWAFGLVAGGVLVATGIYQFTWFKQNSLMKCRSPVGFVMTNWRKGMKGAAVMGSHYGFFCTKCCWVLMAGLLVVGAMSLPLMGVFAIIIAAEKMAPFGTAISKLVGAGFVLTGIFLMI